MSVNQAQKSEFFNLHVTGCGYLSRVRWVDVRGRGRKSEPFLACTVNALRGHVDDKTYTSFDVRVSAADCVELVEQLGRDVDARKKVFITFKIGDIFPNVYERNKRDQQGNRLSEMETAANIKGRLIQITLAKVDGQEVYRAAKADQEPSEPLPAPAAPSTNGQPAAPVMQQGTAPDYSESLEEDYYTSLLG